MSSDYGAIGDEILEKLEIDDTRLGEELSTLSEKVKECLERDAWNKVHMQCELAHKLCNEMQGAVELREWNNTIDLAYAEGIFHAYEGISPLYQADKKEEPEKSAELAKATDCLKKSQQYFQFAEYRDQWNEHIICLSLERLYESQNKLKEALLASQRIVSIGKTCILFGVLPVIDEIAAGKEKPASDDTIGYMRQTDKLEFEFEGRTLEAKLLRGSRLTFLSEYDYVAVRVSGDSMSQAGISPNDYVILRRSKPDSSGDIVAVVFRDEDDKATLKRFYFEKSSGRVVLKPESSNPEHKTRVLRSETFAGDNPSVEIVGIAIAVLSHRDKVK